MQPAEKQSELPHERPVREVSCRDPFWALLFLLHFGFICWLAFAVGLPIVRSAVPSDAASLALTFAAGSLRLDSSAVLSGIAIAVGAAALSALIMLLLLQKLAGWLIRFCFFLAMAALAGAAAALLAYSLLAPGVIAALLFLLVAVWYWCIRHRIDFAAAHVDVAVTALRSAPTLICVALGALLAQGAWGVLWGLSAMGAGGFIAGNSTATGAAAAALPEVAAAAYGAPSSQALAAVFGLLVSFFWVSMLIKDVVAFSSASVLGDWWFTGAAGTHPVAGALAHSLTSSFGTLTLAALLVAVIQAARTMYNLAVKRAKERGACSRNPLLCVWGCLVGCVLAISSWLISWANSWAVVFAALTGQGYYASGLAAMALFRKRGWCVGPARPSPRAVLYRSHSRTHTRTHIRALQPRAGRL